MSKAEKFIKGCTRNCSNEILSPYPQINKDVRKIGGESAKEFSPWLTPDQARRVIEITREEELEYVKYQLELRLPKTLDYNGVQVDREDFINDFIKAIKDE